MKMNCGWYGDGGVFGTVGLSVGTATADNTRLPPELLGPIPPTPDCPICLIPMPLDLYMVTYYNCCGKNLCHACYKEHLRSIRIINSTRKATLPPVQDGCVFCRSTSHTRSGEELKENSIENYKSRVRRGDGRAAWNLAGIYEKGEFGLAVDKSRALQVYHIAANLGSVEATSQLGFLYTSEYSGTDTQVFGKMYLELAALKGDIDAHTDLADVEFDNGNCQLARKHLKLSASAGHVQSMKRLLGIFSEKRAQQG